MFESRSRPYFREQTESSVSRGPCRRNRHRRNALRGVPRLCGRATETKTCASAEANAEIRVLRHIESVPPVQSAQDTDTEVIGSTTQRYRHAQAVETRQKKIEPARIFQRKLPRQRSYGANATSTNNSMGGIMLCVPIPNLLSVARALPLPFTLSTFCRASGRILGEKS